MFKDISWKIKSFHIILVCGFFIGFTCGVYKELNLLSISYTAGLLYLVYLKRIHDCIHIWEWHPALGAPNRKCSRCGHSDARLDIDSKAVFYRPTALINDTPLSSRSWIPVSDNIVVAGDHLKGSFCISNNAGDTKKVEICFKFSRRFLSALNYTYSIILEEHWQEKIPAGYSLKKPPQTADTINLYFDDEYIKELSPLYRLTWENEEHRNSIISGKLCISLGDTYHQVFRI